MSLRRKLFYAQPATEAEKIPEVPDLDQIYKQERKEKKKHLHFIPSIVKGLVKKQNKSNKQKLRKAEEAKEKTYLSQKAKVSEIVIKLKWMESKQEGKLKRITQLESQPLSALTIDEKILLQGLKNSLKQLECKILAANNEISRRRSTIDLLGIKEKISDESSADERLHTVPVYPKHASQDQYIAGKRATQRDRINELREKLQWMRTKQTGKLIRIQALKETKESLSFDETVQLKGLKNSSKRLLLQVAAIERQLSWQVDIIRQGIPDHSVAGEDLEIIDIEYDSELDF